MSEISRHDTDVDQLAAPAGDGGVLVWPSPRRVLDLIESNRLLRAARRIALPGRAEASTGALPIITGHQPEMMHPGVWIKLIAAARLARASGRKAMFVCVDNDLAGGIPMARPVRRGGRWRIHTTSWGTSATRTFEQEPARSQAEWQALLVEASGEGESATWRAFADAFLSAGGGDNQSSDYISRWWLGMEAVTRACGESPVELTRVSALFLPAQPGTGETSYAFVAHLLLNARAFATAYNRALGGYRAERGIRGEAHPIPNLTVAADRIELPLWIWRGDAPRARLRVGEDRAGAIALFSDSTQVCTVDADRLRNAPASAIRDALGDWRLRPRALVLTMYLRLFESDLFIHGIGGAKYDAITDALIRDLFDVEPPGYACVSATARLELAGESTHAPEESLAAARARLRTARFNPQMLLSAEDARGEVASALADRSRCIAEARNLRETARQDRTARRVAFQGIRSANARIASLRPDLVANAERAVEQALQGEEDRRVTHSREWFTGLYALPQLRALCARLPW